MITWFKSHWQPVLMIGLFAAVAAAIPLYGASRYAAGQMAERLVWEDKLIEAQVDLLEAERQLAATNRRLDEAIRQRDQARRQALARVEEEITNAPGFEERYGAYLAHRNSLRNSTHERFTRARADYLSTVTPTGDGETRNNRPELRLTAERRGSALCLEA